MHRLTNAFSQILDKVGDLLMDRASRTDVRDEQQLFLDARGTLKGERPALMEEFERQLRTLIDERIAGKTVAKADFSKVDAKNLTLVDTSSMDESVLNGNITRVVENACHDELLMLNRGMGQLLGNPELSTDANPWSPATIVDAFSQAVQSLKVERRIKFQIMKDLNQAPLAGIASIYADLNSHLLKLNVVPGNSRLKDTGDGVLSSCAKSDTRSSSSSHRNSSSAGSRRSALRLRSRRSTYCSHSRVRSPACFASRSGRSANLANRRSSARRYRGRCSSCAHGVALINPG